ncbi:hypothetical protein DINM_006656 [Dirofilaria immitis]|nr:hypothetical protein [Dirofilaria immitis]
MAMTMISYSAFSKMPMYPVAMSGTNLGEELKLGEVKFKNTASIKELDYRSYKQNESQEGLGTENLMRKEKKDLLGSIRGSGYRNPVYTTTTSTVKIRETFDRTIDDGNAYDKAGTDTDIAIGTGGEMTGRSELIKDSDGRKQLNTTGIRRNGYQVAESTSLPHTVSTTHSGPLSSEHYSTRETFEERCEENYIEEKKSMSEGKELLSN